MSKRDKLPLEGRTKLIGIKSANGGLTLEQTARKDFQTTDIAPLLLLLLSIEVKPNECCEAVDLEQTHIFIWRPISKGQDFLSIVHLFVEQIKYFLVVSLCWRVGGG